MLQPHVVHLTKPSSQRTLKSRHVRVPVGMLPATKAGGVCCADRLNYVKRRIQISQSVRLNDVHRETTHLINLDILTKLQGAGTSTD